MRIFEFIDKYCTDLVDAAKESESLIDLAEFPHDCIIIDQSGCKVPIVVVDCVDIPVADFLTLDKVDFLKIHNTPNAAQEFDNYVSTFTILEGVEAVMKIRNVIEAEKARLEKDVELITTI